MSWTDEIEHFIPFQNGNETELIFPFKFVFMDLFVLKLFTNTLLIFMVEGHK